MIFRAPPRIGRWNIPGPIQCRNIIDPFPRLFWKPSRCHGCLLGMKNTCLDGVFNMGDGWKWVHLTYELRISTGVCMGVGTGGVFYLPTHTHHAEARRKTKATLLFPPPNLHKARITSENARFPKQHHFGLLLTRSYQLWSCRIRDMRLSTSMNLHEENTKTSPQVVRPVFGKPRFGQHLWGIIHHLPKWICSTACGVYHFGFRFRSISVNPYSEAEFHTHILVSPNMGYFYSFPAKFQYLIGSEKAIVSK